MSMKVNVHEAKTHFSKLLARVLKGEEIVISKAGKPVSRLVPTEEICIKRVAGSAKGRVIIADNFDALQKNAKEWGSCNNTFWASSFRLQVRGKVAGCRSEPRRAHGAWRRA